MSTLTALSTPWAHCRLWHVALSAPAGGAAPHDASLAPASLALLSSAERARAQRFVFARDRVRYVQAHAALRQLLAQALGQADPAALVFGARADGKPWLPAAPRLRFNLSHSADTAVIALSDQAEVGVDVEHPHALPDALALAAAHATAAERAALATLPTPAQRAAAFLRLWTRKEACLKAVGSGLALAPHLLEVGLAVGAQPRWLGPAHAWPSDELQLASWQLADGTHLALAVLQAAQPAERAPAPTTARPTHHPIYPAAQECPA